MSTLLADQTAAPYIRAFGEADRDAVIALWRACGLTREWNNPDLDIDRKLTVQPEMFLVLINSSQIVGTVMAGYDGHRGWVNYLGVLPAHQGRGFARQLMHAVEQQLAAVGCPKLNLQVRAQNTDVIDFYRSLGYGVDDCVSLGKRLIPD